MKIDVKVIDEELHQYGLPDYGTEGSAALDLRALIGQPALKLHPGHTVVIETGLAIHIADPGVAGIILPRSGLGTKNGIVLGNLTGLIDSDYQGPLRVQLWNRNSVPYVIERGSRIAQLMFIPIIHPTFNVVESFDATERGEGGFGSTGT